MSVQDLASRERLFSRRVSMLGLGSAGNIKLSLVLTFRNYGAHRYVDALLPHLDNDVLPFLRREISNMNGAGSRVRSWASCETRPSVGSRRTVLVNKKAQRSGKR